MRRRIIMAMAAVAVVGAATYAAAAVGIKGGKHDLSFATPGTNQTDQVCVFCHTPHNAVQAVPLWNRNASGNTAASFMLYTSSQTLNGVQATGTTGFASDSISLFCMSCHDGSALGGSMIGAEPGSIADSALIPNYGTTPTNTTAITGAAKFGTDLTKSHPVNLSYNSVDDTGLVPIATLKSNKKFPLFRSNSKDDNLECASCHAVHGQENSLHTGENYPAFLRSSMAGSALCLGCHVK